jgi:hypothetical protein
MALPPAGLKNFGIRERAAPKAKLIQKRQNVASGRYRHWGNREFKARKIIKLARTKANSTESIPLARAHLRPALTRPSASLKRCSVFPALSIQPPSGSTGAAEETITPWVNGQ